MVRCVIRTSPVGSEICGLLNDNFTPPSLQRLNSGCIDTYPQMRIDRPGLLAHLYFCVDRIRCFFSKMSLRYVRKRLFPQDAARVYSFILRVPRFATFAPPHVLECLGT